MVPEKAEEPRRQGIGRSSNSPVLTRNEGEGKRVSGWTGKDWYNTDTEAMLNLFQTGMEEDEKDEEDEEMTEVSEVSELEVEEDEGDDGNDDDDENEPFFMANVDKGFKII